MEHTTSSTHSSQEQLKDEILHELRAGKKNKHKRLSWSSGVVTLALIALTLLSVAQAAQSATILHKLNSGQIKSSGKPAAKASSGTPLPSNLENLPNMVGGC